MQILFLTLLLSLSFDSLACEKILYPNLKVIDYEKTNGFPIPDGVLFQKPSGKAVLQYKDRTDPDDFIMATTQKAFYANYDQLRLDGNDLIYMRRVGYDERGKKKWESEKVGSMNGSELKIKGVTYTINCQIKRAKRASENWVTDCNVFTTDNKKVGALLIAHNETTLDDSEVMAVVQKQYFKYASYLLAKEIKLDPFKPRKNLSFIPKTQDQWWW